MKIINLNIFMFILLSSYFIVPFKFFKFYIPSFSKMEPQKAETPEHPLWRQNQNGSRMDPKLWFGLVITLPPPMGGTLLNINK